MLDIISEYYQIFLKITQENQVIAGAVSLWGLTVLTMIFRTLPSKIIQQLKRSFIVSFTVDNTDHYVEVAMSSMFEYINKGVKTWFSRSFMILPGGVNPASTMFSLGYGRHYFFYKRKLMWINFESLESSGSEKQKKQVTLSKIGIDASLLKEFFDSFEMTRDRRQRIFSIGSDGCRSVLGNLPETHTGNLALNDNVRKFLDNDLQFFLNNREWYQKRNLAHKQTTVLEGPPGTGKTSFIRAVAAELNRPVYIINLANIGEEGLEEVLCYSVNAIIVIEDFDDCNAVHKRKENKETRGSREEAVGNNNGVSLSGFLNVLDGLVALDNVIVFLTTNHVNKIDPALLRDGRVDKVLHMGALKPHVIKKHAQKIFPETDFSSVEFPEVVGCKIHTALRLCHDDGMEFHRLLTEGVNNVSNIE